MKRLLFTTTLLLTMFSSKAQALLGERPRIVTAYLGLINAKHQTVYDSCGNVAFIVRGMEDGVAVYYFKGEECISYSIVRHGMRLRDVEYTFDQQYKRAADHRWYDVENTCITLAYVQGTAYINVEKAY